MKAKRRAAVVIISACLLPALWVVVHAADKPGGIVPQPDLSAYRRNTLCGLQGVAVVVESLKPEVERLGLARDALQTDVELQLRRSGIKVLSRQQQLATLGSPYLYVQVTVQGADDDKQPLLAVNTEVMCSQIVILRRDPTIRSVAITWIDGTLGIIGRANLAQVRDSVKDVVARFVNDYLAMNSRQPAPTQGGRGSEAK